jgi:type IV pilus assembly protein PilE
MKKARGFTLLELMVVVAIVALLAAIAYPIFTKQMLKAKRAEARKAIADLALREERYRIDHSSYGDCSAILSPTTCNNYNSGLSNYTVAVVAASLNATDYTITATPKGKQAKDKCGTLQWAWSKGAATKTPTTEGCW